MIQFGCPHCGMKLQVRAELAGRSGPCPACKGRLTVPYVAPLLPVPTGPISGPASSLHQAGLDDEEHVGVTLDRPGEVAADGAASAAERSAIADLLAGRARTGGRYVIEKEIARGGMGAVVRAVDCDIRREVAVKYMLDNRDFTKKARFVEEAQITGQLEHPNIVPIHELGVDTEKRLFFAMKMVRGRSLAQVLDELRKNPATAERTWTLTRLLTVMTNVCYAMSYAHARGVIHRDLKPANIMLGDFGETYVMDWGLAKVVTANDPLAPPEPAPQASESTTLNPEFTIKTKRGKPGAKTIGPSAAGATFGGAASFGGGSSGDAGESNTGGKVSTSRELEGELTQDGAILGTPSYMSPEQARGEVHALEQRSDIYSLAAILYEILTLAPPVEKAGGPLATITRVVEGKIKPPEQRTPERVKAGKIPRELSAVAMKGLALRPEQRYQTAEGLRRDIERFQEGRSVSAKQDTAWEATVKFVRRNKGFSAATGTAMVVLATVLAVAFNINNAARVRAEGAQALAEQNYANFELEQKAKNEAIRKSLPATLRAARQLADDGAVPEALEQIALVRSYEPQNVEAAVLRGQILIAQRKFPEAAQELTFYTQRRPQDLDAWALLRLAHSQKTDDLVVLYQAADILRRNHLFRLTKLLLQDAPKLREARKETLRLYENRMKDLFPGKTVELEPNGEISANLGSLPSLTNADDLKGMELNVLSFFRSENLADIEGLRGMPLTELNLRSCRLITSLEALRGMPLRSLSLWDCQKIADLSPLAGMPLEELSLERTSVSSFESLKGMPLRVLRASCPISDLTPLKGMPLESLMLASDLLTDLEPLRGLPCTDLHIASEALTSLEPLRGMPCRSLKIYACAKITDLSPLRSMPLKELNLFGARSLKSLEPLRGLKLEKLEMQNCHADDLSPLAGMPLSFIELDLRHQKKGLEVLREMKTLTKIATQTITYSPGEFWKRYDAGELR